MSHTPGPQLPTLRDLHAATDHTAKVLSDPHATAADRAAALEAEAATLHAYEHRPASSARLRAEPANYPGSLSLAEWSGRAEAGGTPFTYRNLPPKLAAAPVPEAR